MGLQWGRGGWGVRLQHACQVEFELCALSAWRAQHSGTTQPPLARQRARICMALRAHASVWRCVLTHLYGAVCSRICMALRAHASVWRCVLTHLYGAACSRICMAQVLKERERSRREAEVEAERVARVKEMEATMERLRKVRPETVKRASA